MMFRSVSLILVFLLSISVGLAQECDIIYVSPNGSGSGTKAGPTNLQNALTLVGPGTDYIRMAEGTYNISNTLDLISNVTIEGGYDVTTWQKTNNAVTKIYRDNSNVTPSPDRLIGLSAAGISNFGLHDISVEVQDAGGTGVTTYGIYIDGCSNYTLSRVTSVAGNGSDGIDGSAGVDGVDGVDGGIGEDGNDCGDGNYAGGAGGSSWGGGASAGGNGGDGGPEGAEADFWPPWDIDWGEGYDGDPGQTGSGPAPGPGGPGGPGFENATPSPCVWLVGSCTAGVVNYGQNGQDAAPDGADGADGVDGIPGHSGGFFVPGDGIDGEDGVDGSGGGGGGGCGSHGGALLGENGSGPGGGGGGEGGQGGTGATGGTGGGGSFGVYISNNGVGGHLYDCNLASGLPGYGGIGGFPGGLGGQGGLGGWGGQGCGQGGQGGDGSAGGDGGNGGNGAPGISQPLYEEPTGIQVVQSSLAANVEPDITLESTGCTFSDIYFSTTANGIIEWFYEGTTVPQNTVGPSTIAQYSTMGTQDITMVANGVPYFLSEFINIFKDGSPYLPTIQGDDTICPGDVVNFSSTWPISFNVLGYRWDFGDPNSGAANTSSQATPPHTYNEVGTYMVTLQTQSPCCNWSKPDTFYVHVMPVVEPEVFITATTTEICEGESITFGAVPYAGGSHPTFEWFQNGVSSGTGPSFTPANINNGDQVRVRMASSYPCPITPTVDSETITVIEHPNPDVDCSDVTDSYLGAETGFNPVVTVGTAPFEFFWQFGDGGSSTEESPSHLYGSTGQYNANVEVTDTFGCSTVCDVLVDIILPPYVYGGFEMQIDNQCGSTSVQFTDTSEGLPTSWYWDFGDGTGTSTDQSPMYSYSGVGPYTVTLAVSNGVFTDTVVMPNAIEPYIIPTASFFASDTAICDSSAIRFFDTSTNASSWEWDFGDGTSSNLQNPAHDFNDPGTYYITVTVYSEDQCSANAGPFEVTVYRSPVAGFGTDTVVVCSELPIPFYDSSYADVDITNWYYHFSDQDSTIEVDGSVQDQVDYIFEEAGWYVVTQHVVNEITGCRDSAKIFMEVRPHPFAEFYPDSEAVQLPDTTMEFWNTSLHAVYDSVHWDFDNGYLVDGEWNTVGIFQDSGVYDIRLTVLNELGCVDDTVIPYYVWEQETFFIQTAFTPNGDGVNDVFEIKEKGITEWHMQIFDRWGKMVWETYDVNDSWDGTDMKSGRELPQGAYSYQIDLVWYRGRYFNKMGTITIFR